MLFWVSSYMSLWSNILFNCAVVINIIVAFFYPFTDNVPSTYEAKISTIPYIIYILYIIMTKNYKISFNRIELNSHVSGLIWTCMFSSAALVLCLGRQSGVRTLILATILRLIFSMGPEPTLWLLGFLTVS
jgi:inositol 1,4,5-triphosphate receptor type 1